MRFIRKYFSAASYRDNYIFCDLKIAISFGMYVIVIIAVRNYKESQFPFQFKLSRFFDKNRSYSSPSDPQRKDGRREVAASRRPGLSKILPSILKALLILCNFFQLVKVKWNKDLLSFSLICRQTLLLERLFSVHEML